MWWQTYDEHIQMYIALHIVKTSCDKIVDS